MDGGEEYTSPKKLNVCEAIARLVDGLAWEQGVVTVACRV